MRYRFFFPTLLATLCYLLAICNAAIAENRTIRVGIMEGLDSTIWKEVQHVAQSKHLNLEIIRFADYSLLNEALDGGDIDANAFQHKPYLDSQILQRDYKLVAAGYTMLMPMALYSHKVKATTELKNNSEIAIPNDPTNEDRAMRLLEKLNIISLSCDKKALATKFDVAKNPKQIKLVELNTGMLGRALDDFSAAVINTDWAISSRLDLTRDRIASEAVKGNPYDNIIAVRISDKDKEWVKLLLDSFQNPAVRAKITEVYGSYVTTSW